ncbi:hypothetical protein Bbelb_132960 [Branchiostoma belcheri]|nr:hypothetical protein Bbelb_132960 [Branchiostoma belcheri]
MALSQHSHGAIRAFSRHSHGALKALSRRYHGAHGALMALSCHSPTALIVKPRNAVYARPPLMFLEGPSYRSKSFELHKILRAVRRGQFSAPAKFNPAPPLNVAQTSLERLQAFYERTRGCWNCRHERDVSAMSTITSAMVRNRVIPSPCERRGRRCKYETRESVKKARRAP